MNRIPAVVGILVVAGLAGWHCGSSTRPLVYPVPALAPDEIVRWLAVPAAAGPVQKIEGSLSVVNHRQVQKARMVVLYNPPDQIRVDIYALGVHVYSLQSDRQGYVSYQPLEKRAVKGTDNDRLLASVVGAALTVRDIRDLLAPGLAFDPAAGARPEALDIIQGMYVLAYGQAAGMVRYWVEPRRFRVVKKEWYTRQGQLKKIITLKEFIHWYKRNGYPARAELELPDEALSVTVSFKERHFDSILAPEAFWISVPPEVPTLVHEGDGPQ